MRSFLKRQSAFLAYGQFYSYLIWNERKLNINSRSIILFKTFQAIDLPYDTDDVKFTDENSPSWLFVKLSTTLTHLGKSRKLFPKNGRWLRGYPGNFFQAFSRFCNFGEWLRGFSGNYFQVNSMSTYPWKNIFSQKRGMTQRLFRKLFPGEFLMHLLKKKY